ncbi:MAG: alpha-galactosidase, partial [Ignavibacteria bacterium]
MNKTAWGFLVLFLLSSPQLYAQTVWLDELDLSAMEIGWGNPNSRKSVEDHTLSVAGRKFDRGVGTHAVSTYLLNLDGKGKRFSAWVGVDDEVDTSIASIEFSVLGDGKVLWQSGVMKWRDPPKSVEIDASNIKLLGLLVTDAGDGIGWDHADWCDAKLELADSTRVASLVVKRTIKPYVLTPPDSGRPRINGAKVFGVRLGNPFLYTIAATGKRPMTFEARRLPEGLQLNRSTGRITGTIKRRGEYKAIVTARNSLAKAERELRIVAGDEICLTPPMGWNSWNCWACAVDDQKVRASADAMVSSGLANHGWNY